MLKFEYNSESDVPEELKSHYTEKEGVFVLNVEGGKSESDVDTVMATLQKERKARREAEAKANKYTLLPEDFDIDEYNRLKDSREGDIDAKLKEQRERITEQNNKAMAKLQEQLSEKDNLVQTHVKSATLNRAMAENNIAKQFMPAVEALMRDKITVEGSEVYLNEKPLVQSLKEWTQTDEGKYYVAAANNTGGGSNNAKANGDGAKKQIARSEFEAMQPAERMAISKTGIELTD